MLKLDKNYLYNLFQDINDKEKGYCINKQCVNISDFPENENMIYMI